MRFAVTLAVIAILAGGAAAAPAVQRAGANHHLGDDSFVARFGRTPGPEDPESLRMRVHLEYVRALLGARPATRPELAARRTELLGYLDDYIAKGTTPVNTYLPLRSPVFIDDRGAVCAVGYLIERSVGREVAERIAATHRFDYLEDIAAALPEVSTWIAASGFTLDELASIQPAYAEPRANSWHTWDQRAFPQPDGTHEKFGTGTFRRQKMEGTWTVSDGAITGTGKMRRGSGLWTSSFEDGTTFARGPYVANRAHGTWTLHHASGNVAAEGRFHRGDRHGRWRFYYDTPEQTPIAVGRFAHGHVVGTWRHFDATGALVAKTSIETPDEPMWIDDSWSVDGGEGLRLDLVAAPGEVEHQIHQGQVGREHQRLDSLALDGERIYIHAFSETETIYDAAGHRLERVGTGWQASDCRWAAKRKRIARSGDLTYLHGLLYREARAHGLVNPTFLDGGYQEEPPRTIAIACSAPQPVAAERGQRIDALLAARDRARAPTPAFVRTAVLGEDFDPVPTDEWQRQRLHEAEDLTRILVRNMHTWIEWPHIDSLFERAFATMPGRFTKDWVDGDPQEPDQP